MVAEYPLANPSYSLAAKIPILDVQTTTGVDAGKKQCVIGIRNRVVYETEGAEFLSLSAEPHHR